uniref:uncharacterized protein LOC120338473 n=1 Tax=Styela clava TaxID=7725 RepID=UPI0019396197|nr:uncharacterized protein LOC120338473 [Styela clava]
MTAMPTSGRHHVANGNSAIPAHPFDRAIESKIVMATSRPFSEERRATSPDAQIDIFCGGWDDDDDDDDYCDMAPVQPQRPRSATHSPLSAAVPHNLRGKVSSASNSPLRFGITDENPAVVIVPASPYGSITSNASARGNSRSPSPIASTDSDSALETDENSDSEFTDGRISSITSETFDIEPPKPNPSSRTSIPSESVVISPPPHAPKRQPSSAGQAARKYLQMQQSTRRQDPDSPRQKIGLARSSSRVGSGGVLNRISKNRAQNNSAPARSKSEDRLESSESFQREKVLSEFTHMSDTNINEAKRKSRTLDRGLSGLTNADQDFENDDAELGDRTKGRDGAAVMKMITDRHSKSHSLDSKYLQYLEGISKHASSPNLESPGAISDKVFSGDKKKKQEKKESIYKKKSTNEQNDEADDEEEFRKYAATMASKTRTSSTSPHRSPLKSSTPPRTAVTTGPSLGDFASLRSIEKAKMDKLTKKKNHGSLSHKFSIRKSKTLGRTSIAPKAQDSFANAAEAFHLQLANQGSGTLPGKVDHGQRQEPVKSNSLKREKRKSWKKKHGLSIKSRSKERLNMGSSDDLRAKSAPTSPHIQPTIESVSRNTRSPPLIKQSLGYKAKNSSNFRVLKNAYSGAPRERTTSFELDTPHSPKIMSPASTRSMTLDNRRTGRDGRTLVRAGSSGQLGTHPKLKHVNSLNSENSGSNSDISLILDDEFDDFKGKIGQKAGTLSRLLGRKMKERKFDILEFESDEQRSESYSTSSLGRRRHKRGKSATLGSPSMTLRSRYSNSREALAEIEAMSEADLFFGSKRFVRGFMVEADESDEDYDDTAAENDDIALQFESARVNKYATITGVRSGSNGRYEMGSLKKRRSDTLLETSSRNKEDSSPVLSRRNLSLPVMDGQQKSKGSKNKGLGSAFSRTMQKGPSSHLAFSEVLTENEVVGNSTERLTASPLRTRKLQPVEPLNEEPSPKILSSAKVLHRHLVAIRPDLFCTHNAEDERDGYGSYESTARDQEVRSYPNSIFGQDLVTWLVTYSATSSSSHDSDLSPSTTQEKRKDACGMLQALLEEGAIFHVRREHHFQDTYLLYQFHEAVSKAGESSKVNGRPVSTESTFSSSTISSDFNSTTSTETNDTEIQNDDPAPQPPRRHNDTEHWVPSSVDELELKEVLSHLQNVAPDAMFRMVLRKLPKDRTAEELMMIYEEILHIKALAHLSDSVKRELAGVLKFEFHRKRGKTLFSQGDEGRSWYIIVKGAVDVDIQGQGVVCTLHEGDDFGNLAIINDAPRAATIVLAEDNCQLLRVDKHDFVRILKDVEANTVRLKEHEKDVLILQKIHARSSSQNGREKYINNNTKPNNRIPVAATPTRHNHRYAISAGTSSKIVEHVVKSLRPWGTARQSDEAMEDVILMYQVFMSTQELCKQLMNIYQSETSEQIDATKSIKRKVVYFVVRWSHIATHIFYDQPAVGPFLKELKQAVTDDSKIYPNLKEDFARIYEIESVPVDSPTHRGWITVESTTIHRYPQSETARKPHQAVKASDDVMLKVYNANRTYTTVRLPVISTVNEIVSAVAEKQGRESENLLLIQVQSDGDMYVLPKKMTSAATTVGVNGRLFVCSADEKDDIEPLAEQQVVPSNNSTVLELVGSQEIAEHITQLDWELINSIHVMEFVHKVFGSHKFHSVTSNIDVFARRFNQLAYWAPTEICACNNLNKRVHLLRKFIKIAQHLKELQNMNGFMAVMIGLGNQALSRLHGTWDKLPTKYKKMMTEFEAILDPSRNHRAYRLHVAGLRPPLIPYLPLLMKDMTFQHEGNDSTRNGLINFEKMHMMSNSIRGVVQACSKPFEMTNNIITSKTFDETRQYTRNFGVMTDQKQLNQLSGRVETKR